jgi:hypothetical protein
MIDLCNLNEGGMAGAERYLSVPYRVNKEWVEVEEQDWAQACKDLLKFFDEMADLEEALYQEEKARERYVLGELWETLELSSKDEGFKLKLTPHRAEEGTILVQNKHLEAAKEELYRWRVSFWPEWCWR